MHSLRPLLSCLPAQFPAPCPGLTGAISARSRGKKRSGSGNLLISLSPARRTNSYTAKARPAAPLQPSSIFCWKRAVWMRRFSPGAGTGMCATACIRSPISQTRRPRCSRAPIQNLSSARCWHTLRAGQLSEKRCCRHALSHPLPAQAPGCMQRPAAASAHAGAFPDCRETHRTNHLRHLHKLLFKPYQHGSGLRLAWY